MLFSKKHVKFALILMIFAVLSVSIVSATDINSTDTLTVDDNGEHIELSDDLDELDAGDLLSEKPTPFIQINSSEVATGEEIEISLKDSNNMSLVNKNLTATINDEEHLLFTNENGTANLMLDLPANCYVLQVNFLGDDDYAPVSKTFDITVSKINTTLSFGPTGLKNGEYLYAYLSDINGNPIQNISLSFIVNNKVYTYNTNSDGRAGLKISLSVGSHVITVSFDGNDYYNPVSQTVNIMVLIPTSIVIGNSILLTNGYLRIYLKSATQSVIANQIVKITINNKVYTKRTNSEGIIICKPKLGTGKISIKVEFGGTSTVASSQASKQVTGIKGDPKNPLKSKIPLKNGVPNVDYMTGSYVMADGDMKYTLLKSQYKEVLKRDSYCLYMKKKLSKYTFFKSKAEPKLNHIIKREKWNVIERALNTKVVKKNKNGYWPGQITVSLKGKSYTYAEVRDVQNTGYTCGPTSASMCTQVLRNYYCEKYLGQKAGSNSYSGSSTSGLKKALQKFNFKCSFYYKSSFNKALKHLKKGGCALIFHTWNHYVAILDISKDGKKVLVGNPSGDYDYGSHDIPTNWLTVKHMKKCFNNYDTSGLIVKLKYKLSKSTKNKINCFYSSMGTKWTRQNVKERLPQIEDPFY
ncbi:cysteine peptidase family C39 domain-containing protein [Methanobrevibacter sp.]|uniref:cysteine peptidase family C39 domain-containing protein n=1 Tax=Methanobrevibacter sp. TaxID=66852 RepID=UPI0038656C68